MPTLGKKRTAEAPLKQVMFGALPDDSCLSVVQCLKQYEEVTQQYEIRELSSLNLCFCHVRAQSSYITGARVSFRILVKGGQNEI